MGRVQQVSLSSTAGFLGKGQLCPPAWAQHPALKLCTDVLSALHIVHTVLYTGGYYSLHSAHILNPAAYT